MSVIEDERVAAAMTGPRPRGSGGVVAAWATGAVWMMVIFALSSDRFSDVNTAAWLSRLPIIGALGISPAVIVAGNFIVRKCAHFVEYAALSMLTFRALRTTWPQRRSRQLLAVAVALAAACAGLDELRQHVWTLSRSGTPKDVVLDTFGACAGAVAGVTYLYRGRRARRRAA